MSRVDLSEIESARAALAAAQREGKPLSTKDGLRVILAAGRAARNARMPIAGALSLADVAEAMLPEVGASAWIVQDDDVCTVNEMMVGRYAGGSPPYRAMLYPSFSTNRRWYDLTDVYGTVAHAHLAAAQRLEDARIASIEAVIDLERQRDEHLDAANATPSADESESGEAPPSLSPLRPLQR